MGTIVAKKRKDGQSFEAKGKVGGKVSTRTFRAEKEANKWLAEEERRLKGGDQVDGWKMKRQSIPSVIDFYIEKIGEAKIKSNELYALGFLKKQFANERVEDITIEAIKGYIEGMLRTPVAKNPKRKKPNPMYDGDRPRTYSASTVRKYVYALKKVLEFHAAKNNYQIPANLFANNHEFSIPPSWEGERERRLQEGEEEKILNSIDRGYTDKEVMTTIFLFVLETAMRAQEITKAKWSDWNVAGRTLNVPKKNTKTKTFRQVPLSKRAENLLRQHRDRRAGAGDGRIFDEVDDSVMLTRKWRRIVVRAGIRDLRFHDLRHEATSRLFEKGKLHYLEIAEITGHKNLSTLDRYINLIPSRLVDRMD